MLRRVTLDAPGVQGPAHWLRVRANGLAPAARTSGADVRVVELFALFPDSQPRDEDHDPDHRERAAVSVRLAARGELRPPAARIELLAAACAGHGHPQASTEPAIGCCREADRLDQSRLGKRPSPGRRSTAAPPRPALRQAAWTRGSGRTFDIEGATAWGIG